MTRRSLLTSLVGCITGSALATVPPRRRYGRLTVLGHLAHRRRTGEYLRVTVSGEDVTDRCVLANDRRGYAVLNLKGADGRFYIGTSGQIAREIRRGDVRIAPGAARS